MEEAIERLKTLIKFEEKKHTKGELEHVVELLENLTSKVTRLEVINHQDEPVGRAYVKHHCEDVELSFQNNDRTLKIFIQKK